MNIRMVAQIWPFDLSLAKIKKLQDSDVRYVTYHFTKGHEPADCLQSKILQGSLRFGTLESYRSQEFGILGRMGDEDEARQFAEYISATGDLGTFSHGPQIHNNTFIGMDQSTRVIKETRVNDYCGCFSLGKFKSERLDAFRDAEPKDEDKPDAYVTYDLGRLVAGIKKALLSKDQTKKLQVLARCVEYKDKNSQETVWNQVPSTNLEDEAALKLWLKASFYKQERFRHEDEMRLLLFNKKLPGGLPEDSDALFLEHRLIENAIISNG